MAARKQQLVLVLIVFLAVIVADQISKAVIVRSVSQPVPFKANTFFYITHERNAGLVGGSFSENRLFVIVAPILAVGILAYLFRHIDPSSKVQSASFALISGGAVGNLIDRVFRGDVVDFLQFHFYFVPFSFPWKFWPAFNIADISICCGVFLMIVTWRSLSHLEESDASNPV